MGVYKREGHWWGQFRGERFSTGIPLGPDKKEMREKAEEVFHTRAKEILDGNYLDRRQERKRTLGEMLDRWMKDHGDKLKSAPELGIYRETLLSHLGGSTRLSAITSDKIEQYKTTRRSSVGPAAINRELALLRAAFNFAIKKWDWYSRLNPVWKAGLLDEGEGRVRWLAEEEADKLKAVSPTWFWEICQFAIATGLRREELARMTWDDVDLKQRVLSIPDSKSGKPAAIPLLDPACAVLARQVRSARTKAVFYDSKHRPYKPDYLTRQMARCAELAGIRDFRFHDLRHTAATYLIRQGVDLYTVQRILRHSDISVTQRYAHHDNESVRKNIEACTKSSQAAQ